MTVETVAALSPKEMSIHVIIIGAGLAGLAAAISTKVANPEHQVTILEAVHKLEEIGVGHYPFLTTANSTLNSDF